MRIIFDTDKNTLCSADSNQNINTKFDINYSKYYLNKKDQTNLQSQGRYAYDVDTNSLSCIYNLDPEKIRWLQQLDMQIRKIIDKCK